MDTCLLRRCFFPGSVRSRRDRGHRSSPIPDTSEVVTGDDLTQTPSFNMSHLDETRVEDEDVWWVPRDVLGSSLPFDGPFCATRVAVVVHIQPELREKGG